MFPDLFDGPLEWVSPTSCRHNYVDKKSQTSMNPASPFKVSAVCSKCRYHLQLVVTLTKARRHSPDHIHHLVYKSGRQRAGQSEEITRKGQQAETFHYDCSYPTCSATVSLRIVSPLLRPEWVRLLTDPELIQKRAREAVKAYPDRLEGIAQPLPINVLGNLHAYINNALNNRQESKPIKAINKRFMICFGIEGKRCKSLLEFLEFHQEVSFSLFSIRI